jgi:hypothetical protein
MSEKNTALTRSPLLPDRYPIQDFFICDVTDAIPKDDMGSMEHRIFSFSTKPDRNIKEYEHSLAVKERRNAGIRRDDRAVVRLL